MIELRWAQRVGKNPRAGPRTVLEYRMLLDSIDSDDHPCKRWSDWSAVPTVIVPRSSRPQTSSE